MEEQRYYLFKEDQIAEEHMRLTVLNYRPREQEAPRAVVVRELKRRFPRLFGGPDAV